ncbi:TRAF-type domain-containing protein [Aphelenchoides besseyi]|nr:TRAF-type domain-containing protein [Aphelenchoides besseyi]KAI6209458.1 TRAF-type domain-containing protein [Aphelenchoides besseyi]
MDFDDVNQPIESLNPLVHIHCLNCFKSSCSLSQCPLIQCNGCGVCLHECKLTEHCEEICSNTWVACPLSLYGCTKNVRRDHITHHLLRCCAWVIRCNFTWNRAFISLTLARRFKQAAKGLNAEEAKLIANSDSLENLDTEFAMALHDQRQVAQSFRCSRACRFKQRQSSHGKHPILPLSIKQFPHYYSIENSSDEEEMDRLAVMRARPQAFKNCSICRENAGEQHLHILGNLNEAKSKTQDGENATKDDKPSQISLNTLLPSLNLQCGLFMELESTRLNVQDRLVHGFICKQEFRRDENVNHCKYHTDISHVDERFSRCVLGCNFGVPKRIPTEGRIKFDGYFDQFVHCDLHDVDPTANEFDLERFLLVIQIAVESIDGASLNALAATSSEIRRQMFLLFPQRLLISRLWRKMRLPNGQPHWELMEAKHKFSRVQSPCSFKANPNVWREMTEHRKVCPLSDGIKYNELPLIETVANMKRLAEVVAGVMKKFRAEDILNGTKVFKRYSSQSSLSRRDPQRKPLTFTDHGQLKPEVGNTNLTRIQDVKCTSLKLISEERHRRIQNPLRQLSQPQRPTVSSPIKSSSINSPSIRQTTITPVNTPPATPTKRTNGTIERSRTDSFTTKFSSPTRTNGVVNERKRPWRDTELYDSFTWTHSDLRASRQHGPGLHNSSNDCFMNSVLQFFMHTPQLIRFILRSKTHHPCSPYCMFCALQAHYENALRNYKVFTPKEVRQVVNAKFPNRVLNNQEDAHEMLTFMLSKLEPPMPKKKGPRENGNSHEQTEIDRIFGGILKSILLCKRCHNKRTNMEDFRELNVTIPSSYESTVVDCVDGFFKEEQIAGYKCENKIGTPVDVQATLNLSKYGSQKKPSNHMYRLYGFISHYGSTTHSGHYIATMRGYDNKWYVFDDASVASASGKNYGKDAYILFYYKDNGQAINGNTSFYGH